MFVFLSWWVTFTPFRLCLCGYFYLWLACECPYSVQYFIATSTHELNSSLQTGSNATFLANAFHSAVILLVLVLALVLYSCSRWTEFSTVSGVYIQWPVVLLHHLFFFDFFIFRPSFSLSSASSCNYGLLTQTSMT